MIKVVDYGLGNVSAFLNIFKRQNFAAAPARNADDFRDATKLILPGVGAFDHAMNLLGQSGIRDVLEDHVRVKRVPVLGVCVGMQILGKSSEEGSAAGLGWISGRVKSLNVLPSGDLADNFFKKLM